ncbi:MAG TPA: arylsulfatase [Planctomycetota bacterium]|nr:arylsulfatase [Planctomycetota bacterium]
MHRLCCIVILIACAVALGGESPNIVYILADDLGYGDVSCLNKDSRIKTPNMDRLAQQGMIFTDAHSGSAVCTPTRYGILTGRYAWRTHLRAGVLWGFSKPLIAADRPTVASLLKQKGYYTACIGKWHLGMGWPFNKPEEADAWKFKSSGSPDIDYSKPITDGPLARGFDYYFGISASLDMAPWCLIENDRTIGIPSETKAMWQKRTGPTLPGFKHEDILPALTRKTVDVIQQCAKAKERGPFFIYMPLNSPHTPVAPNAEFKDKSGIGDYGDFVLETDWTIGQVMDALEKNGFAENTLIIVTSDNGFSPHADFKKLASHGHNPNYTFRGNKADIFEGGHRVPFIVRWPAKIKAGSRCDDPVCLTDLLATCAEIVGFTVPENAGEDSVSLLPVLLGTAKAPLREATVHQSVNGSLAIRQGNWKLVMCPDSGGWSVPRPDKKDEIKGLPPLQLYDLNEDIREQKNQFADKPEIVEKLRALLQKYIDDGRSTPGKPQANDVPVKMILPRAAK